MKWSKNISSASFYDAAIADDLVDEHMHFVKVEHDIQLANSSEIRIHGLYHEVDDLRDGQLVLVIVDTYNEVQ